MGQKVEHEADWQHQHCGCDTLWRWPDKCARCDGPQSYRGQAAEADIVHEKWCDVRKPKSDRNIIGESHCHPPVDKYTAMVYTGTHED